MENTTPFIVLRMIEYKCWEGSQNDKSMSIKGSFLSLLQPSLHCSYSIFLFGLNDISCFVWEPCIFINERGWWLPAILATFQVAVIGDNCQFSLRGGSDFSMLAAKSTRILYAMLLSFANKQHWNLRIELAENDFCLQWFAASYKVLLTHLYNNQICKSYLSV